MKIMVLISLKLVTVFYFREEDLAKSLPAAF